MASETVPVGAGTFRDVEREEGRLNLRHAYFAVWAGVIFCHGVLGLPFGGNKNVPS